jgi:protein-L-isoaspartate(D-aspartate) O-methyltransferase
LRNAGEPVVENERESMLRTIERHFADTREETGLAGLSRTVRDALIRVPRDRFVPAIERACAWRDSPLPIGHGQTISQPFIVALMTELVAPGPGKRVLEVGCGCGYQAAVLAETGAEVYGVEIVAPLAERAAGVLRELGYANATIRAGDGWHGWAEHAPFDGILVTAAGHEVPDPLRRQLRVGGRLVLPLESPAGFQDLVVVERTGEEDFRTRPVLAVRFVPLTRAHGGAA